MCGVTQTGSVFGDDFRIIEPLDEGGMGQLFVAEQLSTGHRRALKVMHQRLSGDEKLRERFVREARMGSLVDSAHIAEVVAAGVAADGMPWIAMELLEGRDLHEHLEACGPMSLDEVARVLRQVCHALDAAHRAGVVHRDLKPRNIFVVTVQGPHEHLEVKVLDFGIAKLLTKTAMTGTETLGSPGWMAPEQSDPSARIGPATDVWSLGLLVFAMLTGRPFWLALNNDEAALEMLLREVILDPIPVAHERAAALGASLPPGLDPWLARCLERDPQRRFESAEHAFEAFETIRSDDGLLAGDGSTTPVEAKPEVPLPSPTPTDTPSPVTRDGRASSVPIAAQGRRRWVFGAGFAVALGLGAAMATQRQPAPGPSASGSPSTSAVTVTPTTSAGPKPPPTASATTKPPPSPSASASSTSVASAERTPVPANVAPRPQPPAAPDPAEWSREAMSIIRQQAMVAARECGRGYGKAAVQYQVAADGSVALVAVTVTRHGAAAAEACVRGAMSIRSFPPPGVPRSIGTWVFPQP